MACTSPLTAYRLEDGSVSFDDSKWSRGDRLSLPCGQCMGCRLERSRQWAVRCVHESRMHEFNCFITLTYNDDSLPENGNLHYPHFQGFMKRLRKRFGSGIRFYACGEYGSRSGRAHYHACLFGIDFSDRIPYRQSDAGFMSYSSDDLQSLWPYGNAWVGDLTFESAAYCSRYITTKLLGADAKNQPPFVNIDTGELFTRVPEFTKMSLKPGIGRPFYDKYRSDIFPHDRVVIRGAVSKPPRYYAKVFAKESPIEWEEVSFKRFLKSRPEDQTEERLAAQDVCIKARLSRFNRSTF